jgi:hypothetical protein
MEVLFTLLADRYEQGKGTLSSKPLGFNALWTKA